MSIRKIKRELLLALKAEDSKEIVNKINEIIDWLNGEDTSGGGSYKVYTALISQSGTSAPTVKVLQNTLGTIVWSYSDVGIYIGTLTGRFTIDKTWLTIQQDSPALEGQQLEKIISDSFDGDTITILTYANGVLSNGRLADLGIEIRVYN